MELKAGNKFGEYELLSEISREGGFGVVWRVREVKPHYNRDLALKIVNSASDDDKNVIREEAAHWAISDAHPNVVSFLGLVEDDDGQIGFLSHFHEGGTLATWLDGVRGKAPNVEIALRMTIEILDGVEHLHQHDVVHRDLKPANILLAGQKPMLMDFGLSKIVEEGLPKTTHYSGTYHYSSPEGLRKGKGRSVDIWASGVILYEMLEGTHPFFGWNRTQIKQCILKNPPRPFNFDIPTGLKTIVLKALEKVPKNRFHGAAEMRHALEAFIEKEKPKLAKALAGIESAIRGEAKTTRKIDAKQDRHIKKTDTIAADVKKLLDKSEKEFPPIPADVKTLFEKGLSLRNLGKYEESRKVFLKALNLAIKYKDKRATAAAKRYQAMIVKEFDRDHIAAKALLEECRQEFAKLKDEKHLAMTLYDLGVNEIELGNLDQAGAFLSQSLELDKKNDQKSGTAAILQQLGRIENERGHSHRALELEDEALKEFLTVYQDSKKKKDKDLLLWIAGCYQNKGLIYEALGDVGQVESNYLRSLEWHRKAGYKLDLGKLLFLIARLKYREAQYDEGTPYLDEAIEIYTEIQNLPLLIRCLDMRGRVFYTLGQTDDAIAIFEATLKLAREAKDYKEQVVYLAKLGQIYLRDKKDVDLAKKYFEEEREIASRESLTKGYAEAVQDLAQVAHIEKNVEERNRLLTEGIEALGKVLLQVEAEPKKAFITGQIGFFWEQMGNLDEALAYYQRAKKAFGSFDDVGGIAQAVGSIARIKGFLGKKNEEFDAYRELKSLVDGTPYYDIIAAAAINLGEINLQIGNLDEAKMLFQEAEFLSRKYHLPHSDHLRRSTTRLDKLTRMKQVPELSFDELVHELYELVNWFPEAKDSLLRLWFTGRIESLLGNFRSSLGVKFMVCEDDLDAFLKVSRLLGPYADLCLQVVTAEYPGTGIDMVPFPEDRDTFFEFQAPVVYMPNLKK